jgi:hypothetical protein
VAKVFAGRRVLACRATPPKDGGSGGQQRENGEAPGNGGNSNDVDWDAAWAR